MEWIFLVLAVAVLVFGIGVLVVNRRRSAGISAPTAPAPRPVAPPPQQLDTAVEPDVTDADTAIVVEPEPVKPVSLRDRLGKARAALAGVSAGVRGRSAIDEDTWMDLEEALLRADVGLGVTEALLDDLKARVKAKEITEPEQLLD